METQFGLLEATLKDAARSTAMEMPAVLSRAIVLSEDIRVQLQGYPCDKRPLALARLQAFRKRLSLFTSAMERSQAILQGYRRHAGVSIDQYGPGGYSSGARDPAFFTLDV
jgi:hypothetical protein